MHAHPRDPTSEHHALQSADTLLVEEHHLLRVSLALALRRGGVSVRECASPEAALALLSRHDEIRVIVSEVVFQGKPAGLELSARVQSHFPKVRTILLTASPEWLVGRAPSYRERHLIKPVSIGAMVSLIRQLNSRNENHT